MSSSFPISRRSLIATPLALCCLAVARTAAAGGGDIPMDDPLPADRPPPVDLSKANFDLLDHRGRRRRLQDFRGKVVVLAFGYTHCPDVCPTTLVTLGNMARELGADMKRVAVLFITVDPRRDTPEVLGKYIPAFHPSFTGLRGTEEATARAAASFDAFFERQPSPSALNYTVDHTAGAYVIDRHGRMRVFIGHDQPVKVFVKDVLALLDEK